ncbi:unannotated protein [freshwater metagenome]|uniref:Unannotated protein n=1 Tax=freshwater metagenome TaxID=449393 RepID=A0A6J7E6C2_9ZZZZ
MTDGGLRCSEARVLGQEDIDVLPDVEQLNDVANIGFELSRGNPQPPAHLGEADPCEP